MENWDLMGETRCGSGGGEAEELRSKVEGKASNHEEGAGTFSRK